YRLFRSCRFGISAEPWSYLSALERSGNLSQYAVPQRHDHLASAPMVIDFTARSSSVMPSPGAAGTRMMSPLARKVGSVVPPSEMYCGPLSAAGVFNPPHAKRWTDAASDKSGSVSPEASMSKFFSPSKLTILDPFQRPPP